MRLRSWSVRGVLCVRVASLDGGVSCRGRDRTADAAERVQLAGVGQARVIGYGVEAGVGVAVGTVGSGLYNSHRRDGYTQHSTAELYCKS